MSSEPSPDLLTCKICQLPYNEPKRLPCLHTFCRSCLVYHTNVNAVTSTDDGIICLFCPLCKQLCELPARTGIDGLPDHHLLRSILETIQSRSPRPCDRCSSRRTTDDDGRPSLAEAATGSTKSARKHQSMVAAGGGAIASQLSIHCCIRCEEFLCDSCVREHKQNRVSRDHLIVSVGAMKELCQVIAVQQLQKPTIVATLVSKFNNKSMRSSTVADHTQRLSAVARRRPFDVESGVRTVGGGGLFVEPVGLTLTKSDEIVVCNAGDCSISVVDLDGQCLRRLDHSEYLPCQSQGVATACKAPASTSHKDGAANGLGCCAVTAEGFIAVAVCGDVITPVQGESSANVRMRRHRVAVIESLAGRQVATLDVMDAERTAADSRPFGIAVTEDGHVIVSDAGTNCIMIFNADFRCIRRFGRRGSRNCQFKSPRYLAVTPKNDIVVSDYGNHAVKVFNLKGEFRCKFGGIGRDPGRLIHPAGVCADRYGNLFVADRDNQRVQMFAANGRFIGVAVSDTCARTSDRLDIRPLDVAVTSQTRLVVLLTGIEGVDYIEVHIYEIRCSLPPPEVRSIEQIVATIKSLRSSPTSSMMVENGSRWNTARSGKVQLAVPDLLEDNRSPKGGAVVASLGRGTKSQVCVIA